MGICKYLQTFVQNLLTEHLFLCYYFVVDKQMFFTYVRYYIDCIVRL